MTNDQLIDHLKKEISRVKIQRNMYQEEYGKLFQRTIKAESEVRMAKDLMKLQDIKADLSALVEESNRKLKEDAASQVDENGFFKGPKFEGEIERFNTAPKLEDLFKVVPVEGIPDDSIRLCNGWWIKKTEAEKAKKFQEDFWTNFPWSSPAGKWSLPPDHPDNGGALIGQDKEKWGNIHSNWILLQDEPDNFADYLDKWFEPPRRFNLDSWLKVQKWYKSLADYKESSFLSFLIKFYPAPELKK